MRVKVLTRRRSLPVFLLLLTCGAFGSDTTPAATWSFKQGRNTDTILRFYRIGACLLLAFMPRLQNAGPTGELRGT